MFPFMTIERHIQERQKAFPEASGNLTNLLYDIALAAKLIARETTRAGLVDQIGKADSINIQGEEQQKLDIYANDTIIKLLDHTGRVCMLASEENEHPITIPERYPSGRYAVLFDPLDGSPNIDYMSAIGTIFSIFERVTPEGTPGTLADLLQPGRRMVAAGYILYGPSTMLVYTAGDGVNGFTLDPAVGEFILSQPDMRTPARPLFYGINHGNQTRWPPAIREYIRWLTGQTGADVPKLSLRYSGSMVVDVHRMLLAGGIFMYPGDLDKPGGKLRLMYECAPLAFIAQQAGGYASDGFKPILDIQPAALHQRVPFYIGSADLVRQVEAFIAREDTAWAAPYLDEVQYAHISSG